RKALLRGVKRGRGKPLEKPPFPKLNESSISEPAFPGVLMGTTKDGLRQAIPPRVHFEYEVQYSDSGKEVPFVVGVLPDLSGKPQEIIARISELDSDKFDAVLKSMKPHLSFDVSDKLSEKSEPVKLTFESLHDFDPAAIAQKIAPLKELLEVRRKLMRLAGRL